MERSPPPIQQKHPFLLLLLLHNILEAMRSEKVMFKYRTTIFNDHGAIPDFTRCTHRVLLLEIPKFLVVTRIRSDS